MATTARLRIDFQVQEILPDGSNASEARHITFGDEIDISSIKDFFERCGIATDLLFKGTPRAKYIKFETTPTNKINAIKVIRELTGLGLKDAKDVVEKPVGSALVVFRDGSEADKALVTFRAAGVRECSSEGCNFDQLVSSGTPQYMPRSAY